MPARTIRGTLLALALLGFYAAPGGAQEGLSSSLRRDLQQALHSEAQSYLQYQAFAAQARKDGFPEVATLFERIARQELTAHFAAHARRAGMHGSPEQMLARLTQDKPYAGPVGSTLENLRTAVTAEHDSLVSLYGELARRSVSGGDPSIVNHYTSVAAQEREHRDAFQDAARKMEGVAR